MRSSRSAGPSIESLVRRLFVEPRRPRSIARRPDAYWLVVATVCIGAFMGQLDASIVSLVLPTLHVQFHVSIGAVEWVALAYLLTLVSTVVAVGRVADMVGRKLLYTYGFGVFILGSALCGVAPSLPVLLVARVVQAFGAAMLQANSVALITQAMPREKLGRGIGVQGAAQAIGLSLGPLVGGLLVTLGGWRLIFFINVPVGLIGMALGWYLLPRSRDLLPAAHFDWLSLALFVPAIVMLLGALSLGNDVGWLSPPMALAVLVGFGLLGAFVWRQLHTSVPLIDVQLFQRIEFTAGIVSGLFSYMVLFGILFLVPFYLESRRGWSAAEAGLILTSLPLAVGIAAPLAGRFTDRRGARSVTIAGMLLAAFGLVAMALIRRPEVVLVVELLCVGAGLGAFTPANNAAIMSSAPSTHSGVAGGILNMTRALGTSLGVALTGLVFTVLSGDHSPGQIAATTPDLIHGFIGATAFLVCGALLAAVFSAFRGSSRRPPATHTPV